MSAEWEKAEPAKDGRIESYFLAILGHVLVRLAALELRLTFRLREPIMEAY